MATTAQLKNESSHFFTWFLVKKILTVLLSMALFGGGVGLLAIKIPGWSLFLGLPSVLTGFVFLIYVFDEISRTRIGPESLHLVKCSACSKPTLAPFWQEEKICRACEKKISQKINEENKKRVNASWLF